MNDFQFAIRKLWKDPGFAAIAIATFALGIGANVAIGAGFPFKNSLINRRNNRTGDDV
jgi:hypothetical protein